MDECMSVSGKDRKVEKKRNKRVLKGAHSECCRVQKSAQEVAGRNHLKNVFVKRFRLE
jgi:hypothetical protein